ncbi:MAG: DUF2892 domain-containing protein [Bacillaceae bacterium]|uniref:DUF2892 domain-containing protein n=1 Tax=Alkalihalobacterium chitinilyticum TaxID=2980103 RepID=A0ABT5VL64_9BACI|nr:DUF2892 domain-containing protein [Alkalihalobacterium chitinilyticum]MDE5415198.1 DUF2892 domain-containing protein [Alkalihalobacterium chitinilyticum]MEB1809116.1 DUF2892 domain-containing protein [Bacillaceae bacterium]
MKPNIGMINAFVRITCGFTVLAWATAKIVKKPYRSMPLFVAMMGAMKVAEGITRFCPLTYMFEEQVVQIKKQNNEQQTNVDSEKLQETVDTL